MFEVTILPYLRNVNMYLRGLSLKDTRLGIRTLPGPSPPQYRRTSPQFQPEKNKSPVPINAYSGKP